MAYKKRITNAMTTPELHAKWREKIQASALINRLVDHVHGKCELTATQIRAAEILLKKALPDLSAVEHSGEIGTKPVYELSREELIAIAAGGSKRAAQAGSSDSEPDPVH